MEMIDAIKINSNTYYIYADSSPDYETEYMAYDRPAAADLLPVVSATDLLGLIDFLEMEPVA